MKKKRFALNIVFHLVLLIAVCAIIYPFVFMISGAFKTDFEMNRHITQLIPREITLDHFHTLFESIPFITQFLNSFFVAVTAAILTVLIDGLVAYGFTRFTFRGRGALMTAILATMLIPPQVLMVPQFQMYKNLHLFGTYVPLIIPSMINAFGIFLNCQIMGQIPRDLYESAMIDGYGELQIFARIAVPLSKAGLGIQGVLTFMNTWNDFMTPLIYLNEEQRYTLPIGLMRLQSFYKISYGAPLAGALLSCIPVILILAIVGQKYFIQGLMAGAVKG
jgi:ABC-type glycerol-3-phosphate transport system permease component